MSNCLPTRVRLSYASAVLPILRTTFVGSVLVVLALLAGFEAPVPAPRIGISAPARGPLIDAGTHPEWYQFYVQAAYRRAEELDRLRELPSAPTVLSVEPPSDEVPPPAAAAGIPIAGLPSAADQPAPPPSDPAIGDITSSIDAPSSGTMQVDIGEASSTELPLRERDMTPPVQSPATIKPARESGRKAAKPVHAKTGSQRSAKQATKQKPAQPGAAPDLFTALFGKPAGEQPKPAQPH
ncbi:MAG: hypothetical protein OJF62_000973 [Pseudolabrys sp.]|nr:hypothetical protein [Pseudolabrys sp.]